MKRGQVTIFIVLGVVLIISVGIILYATSIVKKTSVRAEEAIDISSEQNSVKLYTQSCLNQVLENALNEVKNNAGYTTLTRPELLLVGDTEIGEYILLYHLPDVDSEIGIYIDHYLRSCIKDFAVYEDRGWEIKGLENIKTSEVIIAENEVIASVNFPVEFKRGDVSFTLDKFIARETVPLKKILDEAEKILTFAEEIQTKIDNNEIDPEMILSGEVNFDNYGDIPYNQPPNCNDETCFTHYPPNSGIFLWVVREGRYEFYFAIKLEI